MLESEYFTQSLNHLDTISNAVRILIGLLACAVFSDIGFRWFR